MDGILASHPFISRLSMSKSAQPRSPNIFIRILRVFFWTLLLVGSIAAIFAWNYSALIDWQRAKSQLKTVQASVECQEKVVASLEAEVSEHQKNATSASRLRWAEIRLERAQRVLESWKSGVPEDPIEVELQA